MESLFIQIFSTLFYLKMCPADNSAGLFLYPRKQDLLAGLKIYLKIVNNIKSYQDLLTL